MFVYLEVMVTQHIALTPCKFRHDINGGSSDAYTQNTNSLSRPYQNAPSQGIAYRGTKPVSPTLDAYQSIPSPETSKL